MEVDASFHHSAQGERDSPERTPLLEGKLNAQQRAFLMEAANLVIVGITADIHTRPDATASAQTQALRPAMRMIWAELQIPNIDPD